MRPTDDVIHTNVSRPGPKEARVLARLRDVVTTHPRIGRGVALRSFEGGPFVDGASETPASEETPTLVFLHGRGHAAPIWVDWLISFGATRRVAAIDLPGFGHSGAAPLSPGAEGGLAFFADPIEDVLAKKGPVVLVGHSLGGLVALELALRRAVEVRALVLVAAMGLSPIVSARARAYLRFGPERLAKVKAALPFLADASGRGDIAELREELYLVRGGRPEAKRAFDSMLPLVGPAFHRQTELGRVDVPTLLIWGSDDEAFPLPIAIDAASRIPRADLRVLGRGHSPHLEASDESIRAVRGFVESL